MVVIIERVQKKERGKEKKEQEEGEQQQEGRCYPLISLHSHPPVKAALGCGLPAHGSAEGRDLEEKRRLETWRADFELTGEGKHGVTGGWEYLQDHDQDTWTSDRCHAERRQRSRHLPIHVETKNGRPPAL
eukprot:746070-Hanusia_phi.AAC.1